MHKTTLGFTFGMAALLTAACSAPEPSQPPRGNGSSSSSSSSTGGPTSTPDDGKDDENVACVTKADKGNALGVGAYCDKTTRCKTGQFCSGDFGAPAGASFCTIVCATDAECGEGATCYAGDSRGKGCAPTACVGK